MPSLPTVRLYTSDGGFVVEHPNLPWVKQPELLIWGERFFVWKPEHDQYREAEGLFVLLPTLHPDQPSGEEPV